MGIAFLTAFFLTICLEIPVAFIFGFRSVEEFALVAAVNIITNPVAQAVNIWLYRSSLPVFAGTGGGAVRHLCIELCVIAAEYFLYRRYGKNIRHPLGLSVSANMTSYLGGRFLLSLF